jgi:hypothetical protein
VNSADSWVDYLWKEGSCSSTDWNCIAYVQVPGQYGSMTWTAGHTYYIMLDDEDEALSQHSFSIVSPALCHACPTYDYPLYPSETWNTQASATDMYGCKIFRFYANYGQSYTFKTGCGDGASADFDTYLALYDGSCTLITANDDGCSTPESKIEWSPTSSGYYYVSVMGMGAQSGNFTLAYNYCYYPPAQPGAIAGPPVIGSAVGETYSIDAVPGATSYIWNFNGSGTVSGTGTTALLSAYGDGTLSVIAYNICGSSYETTREITVIPVSFTIVSGTLITGVPVCMAATQTIVVAGEGIPVTVPNGAILDLVAGMNIFLEPGLVIQSGAYFHGRIDNDGTYCTGSSTSKSNLLVVDEAPGLISNLTGQGDGSFKVYPNPTTGEFTLELTDEPGGNLVRVQCFNMIGSSVMESKFESGRVHKFNLTGQKPGMYVIKVIQNDKSGMQKMIKL